MSEGDTPKENSEKNNSNGHEQEDATRVCVASEKLSFSLDDDDPPNDFDMPEKLTEDDLNETTAVKNKAALLEQARMAVEDAQATLADYDDTDQAKKVVAEDASDVDILATKDHERRKHKKDVAEVVTNETKNTTNSDVLDEDLEDEDDDEDDEIVAVVPASQITEEVMESQDEDDTRDEDDTKSEVVETSTKDIKTVTEDTAPNQKSPKKKDTKKKKSNKKDDLEAAEAIAMAGAAATLVNNEVHKDATTPDASYLEPPVSSDPREGDVVGGIFTPNRPYQAPPELPHDDSLDDYNEEKGSGKWWIAAAIVTILCGIAIYYYAEKPEDIKDVLTGQFMAKKIAERDRIEEENRLAELKKMNKFGTLVLQGNPQYTTLRFNGKPRYGMTSQGQWRELILHGSVPIKNLNIKEPLKIEFSNPGFTPVTEELTEGSWEKASGSEDYSKLLGANLTPLSQAHKIEFDQRLAPDVNSEFFGTITIESNPPGAYVILDGNPLKDKDGNDLKTPVTFAANYVLNEETKAFDEVPNKVDTVLDIGHKIEVGIPFENNCKEGQNTCVNDDGCCPAGPRCNVATDTDCKMPVFVTALQRQNWTCDFDEEKRDKAINDLREGTAKSPAVIQEACTYSYKLMADLAGIKKFAQDQEAERLRVERVNAELMGETTADTGNTAEDTEASPNS